MQRAHDNKHKALEMTMRDVLDGLEEAASYVALTCPPAGLEILSIETPTRQDPYAQKKSADIIFLNHN